jgi:iron complex transport system ATP-binding protein
VTPAVSLDRVDVDYGSQRVVFSLDLEVARGEWVALIGPNGAGKTSLLRAVIGSVPFGGRVSLDGDDVDVLDRRQRARRVALVPQQIEFPRGMKVVDYVLLGRTPYIGHLSTESAHDVETVAEVMDALDLLALADRSVERLSGGEAQRVILARALAQQAPVLLLDEPTSALDIGRRQEVLELVDTLRLDRGLSVLSAMHDLTLAGQFADRLVLMSEGTIIAQGTAREVLTVDLIATHYGAEVDVNDDGYGGIAVMPVRSGGRGSAEPSPAVEPRSASDEEVESSPDNEGDRASGEPDRQVLEPGEERALAGQQRLHGPDGEQSDPHEDAGSQ